MEERQLAHVDLMVTPIVEQATHGTMSIVDVKISRYAI